MTEPEMNQLFDGYYSGRRVFVTGHTGFKGSWLTQWLLLLGAEVTGYSIGVPTQPSLYESLGLSGQIQDMRGDVRRSQDVQAAMDKAAPEVIIHMAAQALVLPSYADPLTTFEINVMGTANVLEAARHCPSVRSVVIVTTDKCYANNEWQYGYREADALGGHDPYSASNAAAEMVVASYRSSFFDAGETTGKGAGVASVRSGNVIGGGDWAADRLVPDCMRALAAQTGKPEEEYARLITFVADRPGHDQRYALDSCKLCSNLDWATGSPFMESLRQCVLWQQGSW